MTHHTCSITKSSLTRALASDSQRDKSFDQGDRHRKGNRKAGFNSQSLWHIQTGALEVLSQAGLECTSPGNCQSTGGNAKALSCLNWGHQTHLTIGDQRLSSLWHPPALWTWDSEQTAANAHVLCYLKDGCNRGQGLLAAPYPSKPLSHEQFLL